MLLEKAGIVAIEGDTHKITCLLMSLIEKFSKRTVILCIDSLHCFRPEKGKAERILRKIRIATPYTAEEFYALIGNAQKETIRQNSRVIIVTSFDCLLVPGKPEHDYISENAAYKLESLNMAGFTVIVGFTPEASRRGIKRFIKYDISISV